MTQYPTYYSYLDSEEWREKTAPIRERNSGLCECCCMRYGQEVHHRSYDRVFCELPTDLLHLCSHCHRAIHGIEPVQFLWPSRIEFFKRLQAEVKLFKVTDAKT